MSMFAKKGKYGLIMPSGKKATASKPIQKPSAFGDSSSSDEEIEVSMKKHVNATLKREHEKSKRQMQEAASQALAEDPSIFEYDSLYDQMVEDKKKKVQNLSSSKKPKYIHSLKKAAERRKLEGELVYEHQAQKEIEKDAEEFRDKESFVTSAYKKKLEERRALEEELAREAAAEAANDVTKQKDLSRFQKHLFNVVASSGTSETTTTEKESNRSRKAETPGDRDSESNSGRSKDHGERQRDEHRDRQRSSESKRREEERDRRRSSEGERRRDDHRDRRRSSEGKRRERRSSSDGRRDRDKPGPSDSREKSDRDQRYRERRPSGGESDQERREDRKEGTQESESNTGNVSVDDDQSKDLHKTEEPPKKKMKIKAGFEVEEEEVSTVDRRKIAAAKKATTETTLSARERYLARKRAKTETETRKPSTSDD